MKHVMKKKRISLSWSLVRLKSEAHAVVVKN